MNTTVAAIGSDGANGISLFCCVSWDNQLSFIIGVVSVYDVANCTANGCNPLIQFPLTSGNCNSGNEVVAVCTFSFISTVSPLNTVVSLK